MRQAPWVPRIAFLAVVLVVLAGCPAPAGPGEVTGVHLGLATGDPATALAVTWFQPPATAQADLVLHRPGGVHEPVRATLVPGPSGKAVYEAVLDELEPATRYAYTLAGDTHGFRTPPSLGSAAQRGAASDAAVRVAVLGDMGTSERAQATVATLVRLAPDLILHTGDISYAESDEEAWARWFEMVEPVAARTPWVPVMGNHENVPSQSEPDLIRQVFALPGNETWFRFDWGPLTVVGLDTYVTAGPDGELAPAQTTWLDTELAKPGRQAWTVAYLHEPAYSTGNHGSSPRVQATLVPVLEDHGVDLVLTGHEHSYERTFPMLAGEPVATGPGPYDAGQGTTYVVTGGAGRALHPAGSGEAPAWSAARASLHHVVQLTTNTTTVEGVLVPTDEDPFRDAFKLQAPAPG